MKFCTKCGQQVEDTTIYCHNCGYHFIDSSASDEYFNDNGDSAQKTVNAQGYFSSHNNQPEQSETKETSTLGVMSIIFGALGGWLGLLLGIAGLATYKKKSNRNKCIIGISLFCFWVFIYIIMLASGK